MMLFPIAVGRWPQVAVLSVAAGGGGAPVLSSATDTAAGSSTATLSVSTTGTDGTLYFVVTTSSTPPSAAQVKAGQDHASAAAPDSGSQAVSGSGVQNAFGTGLTPSTAYFAHFMHEDAATNQSNVASGDGFTTTASSLPTWVAIGVLTADVAADTTPLPAGWQADDIFVLLVESADQAVSLPSGGWEEIANSPVSANSGTLPTRLTAFWKRATGSESEPTIADAGDHTCSIMIAIRGCPASGNPFNTTAGNGTAAGTAVSLPAITTTIDNCFILGVVARGQDTTAARFGSWTNASVTNLSDRYDEGSSQGNGGGFGVVTGTKVTAGNCGNFTCTDVATEEHAMMTMALLPA
jgi:hypothetical protein